MQVTTSQLFRSQTERLQELQSQIGKLQQQTSTGKRLDLASDDPVSFSDAARTKAQLSQIEQFGRNVNSAIGRLNLQEAAFDQITKGLTRINELAIQADTDTNSLGGKREIAVEIEGMKQAILGYANATDENGAALFGGYYGDPTPFVANPDGSTRYLGDDNQIQRSIGFGLELTVNSTGTEVFMQVETSDGETKSIFDIVDKIVSTLQADGPAGGMNDDLTSAISHFTEFQTATGTRLSRLNAQVEVLAVQKLGAQTQLSLLEDVNMEEVITTLKQKMLNLEAAQASFVQVANLSLFNFMK